MPYTIFQIADWFLSKESMSQKKLQKLCYYAQAWSCTILGSEITSASFEAWVHGPVNRALWEKYTAYGFQSIPKKAKKPKISRQYDDLLENVWETYKDFNGLQLEALTHSEDPWVKARGRLGPSEPSSARISPKSMRAYYGSLITGDGVGE